MEELIKQFGLPVATAVFFIYQYIGAKKEHMADVKGFGQAAVTAIDRNTEALNRNSDVLEANKEQWQRVEVALGAIKR